MLWVIIIIINYTNMKAKQYTNYTDIRGNTIKLHFILNHEQITNYIILDHTIP